MQFMARATAQGFMVSKPWANRARYDFLVEHAGRISRVQVKSTMYEAEKGYIVRVGTPMYKRFSGRRYTADEIDYFALYVVPTNTWYIVPFEAVAGITCGILLKPNNRRNKYYRFREAWNLLRNETKKHGGRPILSAAKGGVSDTTRAL